MFSIPPSVFANWPTPNYTNPVTRGPELWIISSIFFFFATVCVVTRLYTRLFVRRWFGLDDWLILIAYISTIGVTTCVSLGNQNYGWNKHMWDVKASLYSGSLTVLYLSRIFWGVATSCVRLSILCLFYRLLSSCERPRSMRWVLHGITAWTVTLLLYYLASGIFPCVPVRAYWAWPPLPESHCLDDGLSMEIAAVINTLSEIVIAILPVIAVFRLRVDPRQRWSVISLLSLSFLVAITGMFRTAFIFKLLKSYDLTWWSTPQWLTSEIEIDMALISACAAPLRPVVGRLVTHIKDVSSTVPTIRQKISQATMSTKGTHSTTGMGHEAVTSWQQVHSRTIDLEGIGKDGFGYIVTITGPPKQRKRLRKSRPSSRKSMEEGLRSSHSVERKNSKSIPLKLKVTTAKTFQVTESFEDVQGPSHDTARGERLGGVTELTASEVDTELAASGLGLREWES